MPTLVLWVIGAVGGTIAAVLLSREARRVRAELDAAARGAMDGEPAAAPIRTLKRDPKTGVYRPH